MFDMLNTNNNKNQNLKQGKKFINKLKQQINNVMSNSSLITEGIDCPSNIPYPCPNMPGTTKCALNEQSCKKISKKVENYDEYGCSVTSGYKYCGKDIFPQCQQVTSPSLCTNYDNTDNNDNTRLISNIDNEFNQLLITYTRNYQLLTEELMTNPQYENDLNVNPILLENTTIANARLIILARQLLSNIKLLKLDDSSIKQYVNNLNNRVNNLKKEQDEIDLIIKNIDRVDLKSKMEDSQLRLTSNYTQYIILSIISIFILLLTYYAYISSGRSFVIYGVIIILSIYVFFVGILPAIPMIGAL